MILDEIAAKAKQRVKADMNIVPPEDMIDIALSFNSQLEPFAFEKALRRPDINFICEVKKASPSKGIIAEHFPYTDIAIDYENAGAACISVLTEPYYFKGSDKYLTEIREHVNIPLLRKDFVVDAYQIYQAKVLGADCVLLICSLLNADTLRTYISICDSLGLSALVEAHDESEIAMSIDAGARIIGVNNRNLKDFTVNVNNSTQLRNLVPENILFVAESGIKTAADINILRTGKVNAVLIGETLMKSENKKKALAKLKGTRIKICGLTREKDIHVVNKYLPDYIGFVFAPGRRHVSDEQAAAFKDILDSRIRAIGVFVNDSLEHIISLCQNNIIDMIQLHGQESVEFISKLKAQVAQPIIKALPAISSSELSREMGSFKADYILIDSMVDGKYGGTGERFDLNILPANTHGLFIAGGIDNDNVHEIIEHTYPYCIDVSSGVETGGYKDENKIKEIIMKVRDYHE